MYIITHRIKSSSEFMDRYLPDGPAGGLFLPRKLGAPLGARICLELVLQWIDETFFVYATVERVGVRWSNCGAIDKGCVVRFDRQESKARKTLIERVRLSSESVRSRRDERIPMGLGVHYFDQRRNPRNGEVLDISPTGARIAAPRPLPTGSDVHLRFEDKAAGVMRHVRGRIVRLDFGGGRASMGVEFHFDSRRERRAIARLCKHLDSQIVPLVHPR